MRVRGVKAQPYTCICAYASVRLSLVYPPVSFCFIVTKIAWCLCQFGRSPCKITRRLLHGSAAWIRARSYRWFTEWSISIGNWVICDLICVCYLWCSSWCVTWERAWKCASKSCKIIRGWSVLDDALCMSCYYHNPVWCVCICHFKQRNWELSFIVDANGALAIYRFGYIRCVAIELCKWVEGRDWCVL